MENQEMRTDSIASILKSRREKTGLTQGQLADKLGLTVQVVGFYEQGIRTPGDDTLKKACRLLGLDYRKLLALKHPEHAAAFQEDKAQYESPSKKAIDEAQERGYKAGGIPAILPDGIIQRLRGGGPFKSVRAVRQAYEELKKADPTLAMKCEICELLESGELSDEKLAEVLRFIRFTVSKETKPE